MQMLTGLWPTVTKFVGSARAASRGLWVAQLTGLRSLRGGWGAERRMEEAPEVQENICWATEEAAASPSVLPEDPPVDRFLPAASRTSSQVGTEWSQFQSSQWLLFPGETIKKREDSVVCINGSKDKDFRLHAFKNLCNLIPNLEVSS